VISVNLPVLEVYLNVTFRYMLLFVSPILNYVLIPVVDHPLDDLCKGSRS